MAALRAEFPFLETVHVRERAARGAPDDEVHNNEVIGVIVINTYRRFAEKTALTGRMSGPRKPTQSDNTDVFNHSTNAGLIRSPDGPLQLRV
jgi:hypothetical protein